jgi:hypothetical protein
MDPSAAVQTRKKRAHCVLTFVLTSIALVASAYYLNAASAYYLNASYAIGLFLICFAIYSAATVFSPRLRKLRAHAWLRYSGLTSAALVAGVWVLSMCVYVRIPYTSGHALGIGDGSFLIESGVDVLTGKAPLTFQAVWNWQGISAGRSATSWLGWGPRRVSERTSILIWPLAIALGIPTMLLWYPEARRFPPGHCRRCGYDLTGNVSGRCPECGERIEGEQPVEDKEPTHRRG